MSAPPPSDPSSGRFIVDIRVFMLSMTVAMCASFFAGVTMGPDSPASSSVTSVWLDNSNNNNNNNDEPKPPSSEEFFQDLSLDHPPTGQHLLVDISNVDSSFLESEERLAEAMVQTVKETDLTMLSYHCHKLSPGTGISCVGVLTESHISFHTWPQDGVITLDLFTCGKYPLFPNALQIMEKLFGIKRSDVGDDEDNNDIRVKWSHELRGFRPEEEEDFDAKSNNAITANSDLAYTMGALEVYSKKQLYSNLTKFYRVDVWETVELDDSPTYKEGLKLGLGEDDEEGWESPELATPGRTIFLNGWQTKDSRTDIENHESLVHPGMFAHPDPKHVAIIGGREGGALREVLKHSTVQSAILIEQDAELFKVAREFFPGMSDCSDLVGRAKDCFEDDLVSVFHDDPKQFFNANYSTKSRISTSMDFILIDHGDPRHAPEFFTDPEFISSLVKAMSPEGVMTISVGIAPDITDPPAHQGVYYVREQLMKQLESHPDIKALLVYEEPRSAFHESVAMLVACKSESCRSRWYARSDQVDFAIYERIVKTRSGERALSYFDGTTQFSYSIPPKGWETVYCRREPTPFECSYLHLDPTKTLFDWDPEDEAKNSFRVDSHPKTVTKDGKQKEVTESHVYAKVDIPAGSYIMPNHLASSLVITERNIEGLQRNLNVGGGPVSVIEDLLEFIGQHGHASNTEGTGSHFVEIGGTVLIREVDTPLEANVGRWVPPHPSGHTPVYSPVYERHRMSFDVFIVATKDIAAGEELFRYKDMWKHN